MGTRNNVPPPEAALSPNGAPGREFWMDRDSRQPDQEQAFTPASGVVPDPALPSLSRQLLAAQLYGMFIAQGNSPSAATSLAAARALQMIP